MTALILFAVLTNGWVELARDADGARPGSAIRYVPATGQFFLWGYMNSDPELLQENPLAVMPEYDIVFFDPARRQWRNHIPRDRERAWRNGFPPAFLPRTYSGITTGSERTVLRGASEEGGAVPRPDLNIVFDQVTWHPGLKSLVYFTGGRTLAYDVERRHWRDLAPAHSPPPVLGGTLAYDPVNAAVVLFGGGHVAERGPDGKIAGYTGTWVYDTGRNDWMRLRTGLEPPPRMNTRLVLDTRNQVLVLFGGDGQSRYLADTWIFDLKARSWRQSRAGGGPPARAGHFTIYDPESGWVVIGGGYHHADLSDMWAYDAAGDRWRRLGGQVPTGFYLSADFSPETRTLVLVTSTRRPDDRTTCNVLFPVRTTYSYRLDAPAAVTPESPAPQASIPKRSARQTTGSDGLPHNLPVNRWVRLGDNVPARTWGSATFDTHRGRILYWGGGHCGYEGGDVDAYDVATGRWLPSAAAAEFPERLWNHGVRLAGVTFEGRPWTDHGRRIYAYDPVSEKMVMARGIRLTTGYDPEPLRDYRVHTVVAPDALVRPPSSYVKPATWTYDPVSGAWELAGPAPAGVDTLLSTPLGVAGLTVDWPARLNDAGYQLVWRPTDPPVDNALFLYRAREKRWERISDGPSPQNLYEMTSLAFDSRRNQVILHGGGAKRDEVWTLDLTSRRWSNRGAGGPPCTREAVYLPKEDVLLAFGDTVWVYRPALNRWERNQLPFDGPAPRFGQNRAMVYDSQRDVVLLVIGASGDNGQASVYALRYRDTR